MTISAATSTRRFAFAISLLTMACSRPDVDAEETSEYEQDHVGIALRKFMKSGPGTVSRAHCEQGIPNVTSRAEEATLVCKGPNGSQSTAILRCESGEAKVAIYDRSIGIFCPERR